MTAGFLTRRQALIAAAAVIAARGPAGARDGTVHVSIEKLAFLPAEIEVKPGETIECINKDPIAHTATVRGGWEVLILPGKTARHVATSADTVEYYCRLHPNMPGRIRISA